MKMPLLVTQERFFRNFDKTFQDRTVQNRFLLSDRDRIVGFRRGETICLYRKKKARFSLFSPTLYARLTSDKKEIRYVFCRPILSLIPYLLWCVLLLSAGFAMLADTPLASLFFFIPGILFSLPIFFFSPREKKRLSEALVNVIRSDETGQKRE